MSRRTILALVAGAILAAACDGADGPAEPIWGRQACAHCAMVLSDRRFGGQLVDADGERRFFDDPGCMALFIEEQGTPARAWVRDADTGRWLDARSARYVAGASSPMDYGFEAHSSSGLAWDGFRARVIERARAR